MVPATSVFAVAVGALGVWGSRDSAMALSVHARETLSAGEGRCRVLTLASFQSGPVRGTNPSYSHVNVDSGLIQKFVETAVVQILAVVGCWQYPVACGGGEMGWEKQLLTHVEVNRPGLLFRLPTAAADAWASEPDSTLSSRPPSPVPAGQDGGPRVPGGSKNNLGASAKVGMLGSTEAMVSSSGKTV